MVSKIGGGAVLDLPYRERLEQRALTNEAVVGLMNLR